MFVTLILQLFKSVVTAYYISINILNNTRPKIGY